MVEKTLIFKKLNNNNTQINSKNKKIPLPLTNKTLENTKSLKTESSVNITEKKIINKDYLLNTEDKVKKINIIRKNLLRNSQKTSNSIKYKNVEEVYENNILSQSINSTSNHNSHKRPFSSIILSTNTSSNSKSKSKIIKSIEKERKNYTKLNTINEFHQTNKKSVIPKSFVILEKKSFVVKEKPLSEILHPMSFKRQKSPNERIKYFENEIKLIVESRSLNKNDIINITSDIEIPTETQHSTYRNEKNFKQLNVIFNSISDSFKLVNTKFEFSKINIKNMILDIIKALKTYTYRSSLVFLETSFKDNRMKFLFQYIYERLMESHLCLNIDHKQLYQVKFDNNYLFNIIVGSIIY